MTTKNDVTGDPLRSRVQSEAYSAGWDRIFGRSPVKPGTDQTDTQQPPAAENAATGL